LKTLWKGEYEHEPDARFINERVHANIQRDGTFSVVPQIPGGITSPDQLRRIADVAEKYHVPLVKLTGGQRIDLLGLRKDDLPNVWRDLEMPSGYAYGKSYRTCKSCVGSDFCRFGLGDSIALALKVEAEFQGFDSPHKMKLAAAGCPRNCSEAMVKDVGAVPSKEASGKSTSVARPDRRCGRATSCASSPATMKSSSTSDGSFNTIAKMPNISNERTHSSKGSVSKKSGRS
jgi:NAD(P)H-nitrite reductase large subunit